MKHRLNSYASNSSSFLLFTLALLFYKTFMILFTIFRQRRTDNIWNLFHVRFIIEKKKVISFWHSQYHCIWQERTCDTHTCIERVKRIENHQQLPTLSLSLSLSLRAPSPKLRFNDKEC